MYHVSVIIPVYNVEQYIERCASSLFDQTLESIEFIFVDDCSPDKSIDILKSVLTKYPHRIPNTQIIHHQYNRGSAAARNTGLNVAQGEYIIYCDSDDWVNPNIYELMYKTAQSEKADIAICDWEEVYPTTTKRIYNNPPANNLDCIIALFTGKMHGSLCNKLIKKDLYTQHDIACKEGMNFCEDLYVIYRLFYFAKSIAYINLPLYYYNKTNLNSYTLNRLSKTSQQGLITLTHNIKEFFKGQKEENASIKKAIFYFYNSIKSSILLKGDVIFAQQIEDTTLTSILSHPTIPIYHKIVLAFYHIKFMPGVKLIRYIYHKIKE